MATITTSKASLYRPQTADHTSYNGGISMIQLRTLHNILVFVLLVAVVCGMSVGMGAAATIIVDDSGGADYANIQAAINAASPEDTIEVHSGTYYENVDVNKQLTLHGIGMPVVDAGGRGSAIKSNVGSSTIEGFHIRNSGKTWLNGGIYINSNNNIIRNNIVSENDFAITLSNANNNTVSNNTVLSNGAGIYLYSSSNNILISNAISKNSFGISMEYSSSNMIMDNNASYNNIGIYLGYSNNNTLNGNTANSNKQDGINLWSSMNNILSGNTINGIRLTSSNDNTIYNNYFKNTANAFDDGINIWNITQTAGTNVVGGPYLGGNAWTKPDGTGFSQICSDADYDEICESSYVLDANNTDFLPLAYYNIDTTPPTSGSTMPQTTGSYTTDSLVVDARVNKAINWMGYSLNSAANVSMSPHEIWNFDEGTGENVADFSTNNDTLTLLGPYTWVSGKSGNAIEVDRNGAVVEESITPFDPNTATMSFWFKAHSGMTGGTLISTTSNTNSLVINDQINIGMLNRKVFARVSTGGINKFTLLSPANLNDDNWHHLAFVLNNSDTKTARLYIDGVDVANTAIAFNLANQVELRLSCGEGRGNGCKWNGAIDELRIYNTPLDIIAIDGANTITVSANDTAGNMNSSTNIFTVSVSV